MLKEKFQYLNARVEAKNLVLPPSCRAMWLAGFSDYQLTGTFAENRLTTGQENMYHRKTYDLKNL
ncbi:hypothetical protein KSZ_70870 [Dictyobacter formicarum]|uniref:Uncharacterized protein n=1 Tax=Dictyobacter formicarum TaxID=2778368 RepID=A0ABQ3VUU8_9CHLR|nr:hypothetical protein KSZ_70870 [Dictyobacter formicarum]